MNHRKERDTPGSSKLSPTRIAYVTSASIICDLKSRKDSPDVKETIDGQEKSSSTEKAKRALHS